MKKGKTPLVTQLTPCSISVPLALRTNMNTNDQIIFFLKLIIQSIHKNQQEKTEAHLAALIYPDLQLVTYDSSLLEALLTCPNYLLC
jgi:hypothetical protein